MLCAHIQYELFVSVCGNVRVSAIPKDRHNNNRQNRLLKKNHEKVSLFYLHSYTAKASTLTLTYSKNRDIDTTIQQNWDTDTTIQ